MFANMTPLEKKLCIVVGSMLPIVLLFVGFFWFMDSYDANNRKIDDLMAQIEEQEDKQQRGVKASDRRGYYRITSLPAKTSRARSVYKTWLDDVIKKECGMTYNGVRFKEAGALQYERDSIGIRNVFSIRPKGTLEQLTKFLHTFYSADQMHRINKLSIKPISKASRGKPPVLTGELQTEIEIETLSMKDGPENIDAFPAWKRDLPELDEFTNKVLSRNIFGPANNEPSFDSPRNTKFKTVESEQDALDKYETVVVSVKDADKDNLLSFELVEQSGQEDYGVVLGEQPRTASVRRISLRVPKQFKATTIPISLKVSDDGLPAKSDQIDFSVVFTPPKTKKVAKKKDPVMAKEVALTYVIGLMRGSDNRWVARVHLMTNPRSQELGEGDSITLDKVEWKVVEVTPDVVTFEIDGERKSFEVNSCLADPIKAL